MYKYTSKGPLNPWNKDLKKSLFYYYVIFTDPYYYNLSVKKLWFIGFNII